MGKARLTKEQAIKGHREMWNWIAEQKENGTYHSVHYLKSQWCNEHNINLHNDCYCCEYASQQVLGHPIETYEDEEKIISNYCEHCPLIWGTEGKVNDYYCENGIEIATSCGCTFHSGLWLITEHKDGKECAEICRKIAFLEVKEDV